MRKHFSIFTLLLSAVFVVGGAGVAHALEDIRAIYVSIRGQWSNADMEHISPQLVSLPYWDRTGKKQIYQQVFTAVPPAGHQVTKWLWNDDIRNVGGESSMKEIAGAQSTCTIDYKGDGSRALGIRFDYILFNVTFDGNGGKGDMVSLLEKNYDSAFPLPPNDFTRTGYHFIGWKTNGTEGAVFKDKAQVTGIDFWNGKSFDSKLYAQWAPNTYTVHFDDNGATGGSMEDELFTYDVPKTLADNAFEKDGFAFSGWWRRADARRAG